MNPLSVMCDHAFLLLCASQLICLSFNVLTYEVEMIIYASLGCGGNLIK